MHQQRNAAIYMLPRAVAEGINGERIHENSKVSEDNRERMTAREVRELLHFRIFEELRFR